MRLHGGVALFFSLPPSLFLLGLLSHIHTLTTKWQRDFFPLRAYRETATDNDAGGGDSDLLEANAEFYVLRPSGAFEPYRDWME